MSTSCIGWLIWIYTSWKKYCAGGETKFT